MSRNGSGTYTVPNTFVPSTRIASAEVNANFADIATALTSSLATDGQSAMTGQFKSASGTISAPGISFASELGSGWYRAGSNDFRFSVAGADVLKATAAGITIYGALTATISISDASITNVKLANMAASTIKANVTGGAAVPTDKTLTEVLDALAGSTQGSIMYRGASAWTVLTPGTSGQYLMTQGAAANPAWGTITVTQMLVRRYYAEYTANANLTTVIPVDDTIPTSSEGTQILSQAVVVDNATQRVRLRFQGMGAVSSADWITVALFQGSTCIAATTEYEANGAQRMLSAEKEVLPGAAGTYTFTVRVGAALGTARLNGNASARNFGGVAVSTLICEVIEP